MWKMYNPNPHGKHVGDCTVRAISIATNKPWYDVFFGLALQGATMCDMPSANAVTTAYLRSIGFKRRTMPETCAECYTVTDFCKDHPHGVYILGIGTHMVAIIDGNYWDSWDSGNETPVYYFEKAED